MQVGKAGLLTPWTWHVAEGPSSPPHGWTSLGEAALLHPGTFSVLSLSGPRPVLPQLRGDTSGFFWARKGERSFSPVPAASYGAEGRVTFRIQGSLRSHLPALGRPTAGPGSRAFRRGQQAGCGDCHWLASQWRKSVQMSCRASRHLAFSTMSSSGKWGQRLLAWTLIFPPHTPDDAGLERWGQGISLPTQKMPELAPWRPPYVRPWTN